MPSVRYSQTPEDQEPTTPEPTDDLTWLQSFPLRARVDAERFDADARLWREISAIEGTIFDLVTRTLRERSGGRFNRLEAEILRRFALLDPPEKWRVCGLCAGSGSQAATPCGKCSGSGYEITGTSLGEVVASFSLPGRKT